MGRVGSSFLTSAVACDERVDRRLAFGRGGQVRGGRLVHHVPQRDPLVTRVGRHDGRRVRIRLGPPLRRHPIRTGIGDPDVPTLQTGRHAEARVEQDRHDLQPMLVRSGQEVLEIRQKRLRIVMVDQRLQKHSHAIEPHLPGIAQFPVDDRMIVVQPHLHAGRGVRGHVVRASHPPEVIRLALSVKCKRGRRMCDDGNEQSEEHPGHVSP